MPGRARGRAGARPRAQEAPDFLPPALPAANRGATLVFKEQDKRNLVGAAWVVRPHAGPRPYLHYGDIKEAMEAVRKAQDASVGDCRIVTFGAARDLNQKIEFVGALDAVTVVDTAPCLPPKG